MAPYGYEYKQNRSSQSVQWNGFTGTIPFVFKTETNRWVKGRECYLNTKIRIVQTDSLNTQGTLRAISDNAGNVICYPYIAKNAISTLFSTAKILVNDKLTSNLNEVAATNTLYKTIFDSKAMQETIESTCPIFCQSTLSSAPAVSSIIIPTYTIPITAQTANPIILGVGCALNPVVNGITVLTPITATFAANAANNNALAVAGQTILLSYNNYVFNAALPGFNVNLTQATSVVVPQITIPIVLATFPSRVSYAQKCQLLFNQFNEMELNWTLPFPIFQSNEWIPPHTKIEMDFNVNSNWQYELIQFAGIAPTGGIGRTDKHNAKQYRHRG